LMQKTKSAHILERWETRYDLSGGDIKFEAGTNLYDKDLPLAAEVGKSLGADIPVTEALAKLGIKLNGGKSSILPHLLLKKSHFLNEEKFLPRPSHRASFEASCTR